MVCWVACPTTRPCCRMFHHPKNANKTCGGLVGVGWGETPCGFWEVRPPPRGNTAIRQNRPPAKVWENPHPSPVTAQTLPQLAFETCHPSIFSTAQSIDSQSCFLTFYFYIVCSNCPAQASLRQWYVLNQAQVYPSLGLTARHPSLVDYRTALSIV